MSECAPNCNHVELFSIIRFAQRFELSELAAPMPSPTDHHATIGDRFVTHLLDLALRDEDDDWSIEEVTDVLSQLDSSASNPDLWREIFTISDRIAHS